MDEIKKEIEAFDQVLRGKRKQINDLITEKSPNTESREPSTSLRFYERLKNGLRRANSDC